MDTAGYVALTRQSGLFKEMQTVANNMANISTVGYRREGVVFAEMVQAIPAEGGSVAMAAARGRYTSELQGGLDKTDGTFDFAIEGMGFFMVETPDGPRLTRAGAFTPNVEGELVDMNGNRLLDNGESPIFVPPDAEEIAVAADGTISVAGQPLAQVAVVRPADGAMLTREDGVLFRLDGDFELATDASVAQGYLEGSNVDPVSELTRMIEVQRSYELGQNFLNNENDRIRSAIRTLGQS
jgi:flagellar basal-body rod protein FlgF